MRWLLVLVALSAFAQEGHQVVVPVIVTAQGRHIPRLKATDFRILEDGRPRRITAFSEETPASPAGSNTDPRHTYVIVIDALHSTFSSFDRVCDALIRFVDRELSSGHSGDQYALMVLGHTNKVVEDATSEPADLLTALRSAEFPEFIRDSENTNIPAITEEFTTLLQRSHCGGCSEARAAFSSRTRALDTDFLRQLSEIVRSAARFEGSRTIILISDGIGRELKNIPPSLEELLKLATDLNVRVYALRSVPRQGIDDLAELSRQTGGLSYENSANLLAGIRRAFTDGRHYYVLTYTSESRTEGHRAIAVTTRNPQWRITAKPGYWGTR